MYQLFQPIDPKTNMTSGQEIEGIIDAKIGDDGIRAKVVKALEKHGAKKITTANIPNPNPDNYQDVGVRISYYADGEEQKFSIRTDEPIVDVPPGSTSIELTSPILATDKQVELYLRCVKAAKKEGFTPIASGGVHTHIGLEVNNIEIAAILKAWTAIEPGVLKAFPVHDERKRYIAPLDRTTVDLIVSDALKDPSGTSKKFEKDPLHGFELWGKYNFPNYLMKRYLTDDYKPAFQNQNTPLPLSLNSHSNEQWAAIDEEIWQRLKTNSTTPEFKAFIKQLKTTKMFMLESFGEALGIKDWDTLVDVAAIPAKERHITLNIFALRKFGTGEIRIGNSTVSQDLLEFQREFSHKFFVAVLSQDAGFLQFLESLDKGHEFSIFELAQALKLDGGAGRIRNLMAKWSEEAKEQSDDMAKYRRKLGEESSEEP
jgi:Putative amidoligase enzyme